MVSVAGSDAQPDRAPRKIVINMVLDESRLPAGLKAWLEEMKLRGKLKRWDGLEESPAWNISEVYTLRLDDPAGADEADHLPFAPAAQRALAAGAG